MPRLPKKKNTDSSHADAASNQDTKDEHNDPSSIASKEKEELNDASQQEETSETSLPSSMPSSTPSATPSSSPSLRPLKPSSAQILPTPECTTGNPMQKISCYSTNHPVSILSAALTCIIFFTCFCMFKRRRSNVIRPGWKPSERGEYAAIAVYDELLDDFEREEMSSYGYSYADGSDDDSVGTIISQWSNGVGPSSGKVEMIPFDDGNLTLREVNG